LTFGPKGAIIVTVMSTNKRKDFRVQFAHLHVTVENTPPHESLRSTAVAVSIDERIRRMHSAREDELRRRGRN
jgi:hypothetical protein